MGVLHVDFGATDALGIQIGCLAAIADILPIFADGIGPVELLHPENPVAMSDVTAIRRDGLVLAQYQRNRGFGVVEHWIEIVDEEGLGDLLSGRHDRDSPASMVSERPILDHVDLITAPGILTETLRRFLHKARIAALQGRTERLRHDWTEDLGLPVSLFA